MSPAEESAESDSLNRRAAAREVNGRRVNEAIERGSEDSGRAGFVCECGYMGCTKSVQLTIDEYEAVRSSFDRFLVLPGHEIEAVDEVVERHREYLVVIKRESEAREMASRSDERTS